MRTAWGYDVSIGLDSLISAEDFCNITGYSNSAKVVQALNAASQAVRNYCGWHICPQVDCTAYLTGGAVVTRLPAAYVSAVTSVTEDGEELTSDDYKWRRDGLLKRAFPYKWTDEWDGIEVEYTAGYSADAVPDLAEVICNIASGVLAVSAGVSSESADGVSISYSSSASSIAASLTSAQKGALAPYKLTGSHAA